MFAILHSNIAALISISFNRQPEELAKTFAKAIPNRLTFSFGKRQANSYTLFEQYNGEGW